MDKSKTGYKKKPIGKTPIRRHDRGGDDSGIDSDENSDHSTSGRNEQPRGKSGSKNPRKDLKKDRASAGNSDSAAGEASDGHDDGSGRDDNSEAGDADDSNGEGSQQGNSPKAGGSKKTGQKKPKRTGKDQGPEEEDEGGNEDEGANEELDETEKTAVDIEQIYELAGLSPPSRLRVKQLKKPGGDHDDSEAEQGDEGKADEGFVNKINEAIGEVEEAIEEQISQINANPEWKRRGGLRETNPKMIAEFGEASKILQDNAKLKTIFAKNGMKVGGVAIRVISIFGGVALFGVGAFLSVAALNGGPVKLGAAAAEQIIKGGQKLGDKVDKKLEKDKLKTFEAKQLMGLLGKSEEDVMKDGPGSITVTERNLAALSQFKLLAAAEKARVANEQKNP